MGCGSSCCRQRGERGSVRDAPGSAAEIRQRSPLQLYRNEIAGFDGLNRKAFSKALIVADGKLACDTIDDRITEVKGLLDYMLK